jgi:MFS superfamily sulfate permease-like transporter
MATGMAGAMLVAMGATGMGAVIKYIPKPVGGRASAACAP